MSLALLVGLGCKRDRDTSDASGMGQRTIPEVSSVFLGNGSIGVPSTISFARIPPGWTVVYSHTAAEGDATRIRVQMIEQTQSSRSNGHAPQDVHVPFADLFRPPGAGLTTHLAVDLLTEDNAHGFSWIELYSNADR